MHPPFDPPIGLGTAVGDTPRETVVDAVVAALEAGYRHVDTAQVYGTEAAVGEALRRADVDPADVFVATKTLHQDQPGPDHDSIVESVRESRERLGVDVIDLLYVHWPMGFYEPEVAMPAFDALREAGVIEHVGLSNFSVDLIDEAREHLEAPLFAHQVETHPLLQQDELVEWARAEDVLHVAYSPLATGHVGDVPELGAVAERHDATPEQVAIAWLADRENVVPIPKSTDPAHLRANLAALDLELTDADRAEIAGIGREERFIDPSDAPWNQP